MLFYKLEGSIKDINTMVITPIEIMLRDIGTTSTTGFAYDRECVDFIMANPHLDEEGIYHGMIHSHHTMAVFFSQTDVEELQDNVENHNVYLSLVINNFMDMAAKVSFVAVNNHPKTYSCPDEEGGTYELEMEHSEKVMMVYDCKIEQPKEEIEVDSQFKRTLQNVRMKVNKRNEEERKKKEAAEAAKKAQQGGVVKQLPPNTNNGYGQHGVEQGFHEGNKEAEDLVEDWYDDFFAYCFAGGSHSNVDADAWVKRIDLEKAGEIVVNTIMDNYATYYQNFFEVDKYGLDSEEFEDAINDFIEYCEYGQEDFPWLDTLMEGLVKIRNKFEELNLNQKVNGNAEV